jgi:peptide-methionine (S)-S-oxide reductase
MMIAGFRHTVALAALLGATFGLAAELPEAGATQDEAVVKVALATFAGGCFWCMEPPFDKLEGVISTTAGYAGGPERNPGYAQVSAGRTGHAEVVQVAYDPARVNYETLLKVFWKNIDPFAENRQFCDAGRQYRSAIYYHDERQRAAAEASLAEITERFEAPVATRVEALGDSFHAAEEYHQDYYLKNPVRYRYYRLSCGRDRRLKEIWGADTDAQAGD